MKLHSVARPSLLAVTGRFPSRALRSLIVTGTALLLIASEFENAVCILYIAMPLLTSFDSDLIPVPTLAIPTKQKI